MSDTMTTESRWVLAVDSSTEHAGVAISNGRSSAEMNWTAHRDQTVTLLDQVDRVLCLAGIEPAGIGAVVVATGPGMFSGLRVGMSVAKGLVLGLGVPLVGVSTLEATALPFTGLGVPVVPVVAAGRGRLVWSVVDGARADASGLLAGPRNGTIEDLAATLRGLGGAIVCGEIAASHAEVLAEIPSARLPARGGRERRAMGLLEIGQRRLERGDVDDPVRLEPVYLHAQAPRAATAG